MYTLTDPSDPGKIAKRSDEMAELAKNYHDRVQQNDYRMMDEERRRHTDRILESVDTRQPIADPGHLGEKTSRKDVEKALLKSANGKAAGMDGIPYELWNHVIGFLELEPYALLACCLTCSDFYHHAAHRLKVLFYPDISLNDATAFDSFVEDIRTTPGRAQSIKRLTLVGRPPLVFSLVPYRLASQFTNLRSIYLKNITEAPDISSSTWPLYGRAFRGVDRLTLDNVRLPSFMDFVRFITSFRVIKSLVLISVSCKNMGAPADVLRSPCRLNNLDLLDFYETEKDGGYLLGLFSHWFSLRGGSVRMLSANDSVLLHPSGSLLLQSIHAHLQTLLLSFHPRLPTKESRRSWQKSVCKSGLR